LLLVEAEVAEDMVVEAAQEDIKQTVRRTILSLHKDIQ
jgi:hypothetical protein|tara:strand:- start:533 stop:646 length:114 start_codon:yes stop_codon:yes gene_type:complete